MKVTLWVFLTLPLLTIFSCKSHSPLETVSELDIEKYQGKWYEIARLPNRFEEGLKCVTAEYRLREDGKIAVVNQGHKIEQPEKVSSVKGVARIPKPEEPGRLKVSFFWPFSGDYYILKVDEDYQLALVGSPSRKYLWILARNPQISESEFKKLTNFAADEGFDIGKLIRVEHDC
jgi:apolipoprotein D and lipocalin family protein